MSKHRLSASLINTSFVVLLAVSIVVLFFPHLSFAINANDETALCFSPTGFADDCEHGNPDGSSEEENDKTSYCSFTCDSGFCCSALSALTTNTDIHSISIVRAKLASTEEFRTDIFLYSIFKPPKI